MKIIDILDKIARGEEVPKKIYYENKTYFYDEEYKDYFDYDKNYGLIEDHIHNNYGIINSLNDEVEILEITIHNLETKNNNMIEKIDKEAGHSVVQIIDKINEIIDRFNNL